MSPNDKTEEKLEAEPAWGAHGTAAATFAAGLSFRNVSLSYGAIEAVRDVTFDLRPGEVACLLGPSGCGKTTLLRIAAGVERPSKGKVFLAGEEVAGPQKFIAPEKRGIGLMFQDYALFPHMTNLDNVAFGPIVLGLARGAGDLAARVEHSLQEVGLWDEVKDALDGPAQALNPGQQQRLCIARAVATSPEIILMDEPCSALDPVATLRIENA